MKTDSETELTLFRSSSLAASTFAPELEEDGAVATWTGARCEEAEEEFGILPELADTLNYVEIAHFVLL